MEHLKNKTLYISFDVDSLEPKEMPCTGTKVSNGIQINKLCTLIQNINNLSKIFYRFSGIYIFLTDTNSENLGLSSYLNVKKIFCSI